MNPIELSLFASRIQAICDEMGAVLRRTAFSPNIRDRLDYSCAIFDADGQLCAQAAHIPVHLGSMAYAMADIIESRDWLPGDTLILNDPYLGGTHLPDVTLISPLHIESAENQGTSGPQLIGFVANRAHYADIGADKPGSMPIATCLSDEGMIIPPTRILIGNQFVDSVLESLTADSRNPAEMRGDISAQVSANRIGLARLQDLVQQQGVQTFAQTLVKLNNYAERLARQALSELPSGQYQFTDTMDDDGLGNRDIAIHASVKLSKQGVEVDFTGSSAQVAGNVNCPLSVAAAGVLYVFRCLMPNHTPACAGAFRPIRIHAPVGSLLNAQRPAAAGNVETSSRVVDVIMGALAQAIPERIPAASHGSMNNLAMGSDQPGQSWDYYETIGGGMGAGKFGGGLSAVQTHMTNTLNSPIEVLESRFPLRVLRYQIRQGSGGTGEHPGGDGLIREFEFLKPAQATLLTERRLRAPWGIGASPTTNNDAAKGINRLNQKILPGKIQLQLQAGDILTIETPGGGGWSPSQ